MPTLPLSGVRVMDMTVVWAGTYCSTLLADLGAEVIRVESTKNPAPLTRGAMTHPTEELIKSAPPMFGGMPGRVPGRRPWNRFPVFNAHGRNKLSMTVDLLQPGGRDIFNRLVQVSDVFVENNVTETMDKLGISYESLRAQRPDMVMLRMPAYGSTGPYKNFRSLGIHMEARSDIRCYGAMPTWTPPRTPRCTWPTQPQARRAHSPCSPGCTTAGARERDSSSSWRRPKTWLHLWASSSWTTR